MTDLINTQEACSILGCRPDHLHSQVKANRLKVFRPSRVYWHRKEVEAMASRSNGDGGAAEVIQAAGAV
jgi:hypothetical protein